MDSDLTACAVDGGAKRADGLRPADVLPLLLLPALAAAAAWLAPAWILMWGVAFGLFLGVKWLAWREAGMPGRAGRILAWFLLWPGMDARRFTAEDAPVASPERSEWVRAAIKTALGSALVWGAARGAAAVDPLLGGWTGMIGLALGLHCGLFHLLSLAWRARGVEAAPIMDSPLRSASVTEFWGRRWNLAFSLLSRRLLLRPLAGRFGLARASLAVFAVSGLLHELVISLPARAGWGLPAAYFALQGLAMLFERGAAGRRLGLGSGWRGRAFMFLVTAGPAYWLFHPPFVHRVILPFLGAAGALGDVP